MQFTSGAAIEDWLEQLHLLERTGRCAGTPFVKPFHLATLAHTLRQGDVGTLALPDEVADYADTMNLWGALGIASPFRPKQRHATGRYHPITLLEDAALIEDAADALTALFKPVCAGGRTLDAVQTMLRELIDNCFSHSAVRDGLYGILCGQVWNGGRKAQIALSDSGIGIRASLAQNGALAERLAVANSCELATEYGVTSKPGAGHTGYGLAVARGLLRQNQGMLYVRSGSEAFRLCRGFCYRTNVRLRWDGTLLVIEWDLDRPVDITELYKSFPMPRGMDHDDFAF